jgi:uncharacterized protein
MILEGAVTNVAAFGAFVDIGVHQDGLVHVSAMAHTFVKDPRDVVKPGDIVRVKVIDIDTDRKRIALSLRLDDDTSEAKDKSAKDSGRSDGRSGGKGGGRDAGRGHRDREPAGGGALAEALRRAGLGKDSPSAGPSKRR